MKHEIVKININGIGEVKVFKADKILMICVDDVARQLGKKTPVRMMARCSPALVKANIKHDGKTRYFFDLVSATALVGGFRGSDQRTILAAVEGLINLNTVNVGDGTGIIEHHEERPNKALFEEFGERKPEGITATEAIAQLGQTGQISPAGFSKTLSIRYIGEKSRWKTGIIYHDAEQVLRILTGQIGKL